jgi:hypothetical protein
LQQGYDNPTDVVKKTAAEIAVERVLEKLGTKKQKIRSELASRTPAGRNTRFQVLKNKLKKKTKR